MGRPAADIAGMKFQKLLVLERSGSSAKAALWRCLCDCGNFEICTSSALVSSRKTRCGKCKALATAELNFQHGHAGKKMSPTYVSWYSMLTRATNPNIKAAHNYSLRGIAVCDRWRNFVLFLEDMGERPPNTSLDRIDVNGMYEPSNCRWADATTQANNKRRRAK